MFLFIGPQSSTTLVRVVHSVLDDTIIRRVSNGKNRHLVPLLVKRTKREIGIILQDHTEIQESILECLEELNLPDLDFCMFIIFICSIIRLYCFYSVNPTKNADACCNPISILKTLLTHFIELFAI